MEEANCVKCNLTSWFLLGDADDGEFKVWCWCPKAEKCACEDNSVCQAIGGKISIICLFLEIPPNLFLCDECCEPSNVGQQGLGHLIDYGCMQLSSK